MGVGAHVHSMSGRQSGGSELVDEDKGPDHRPGLGGKRAPDLEVAKIVGDRRNRFHGHSPGAVARIVSA